MSQKFHKFWLIITAVVVGAFGPVFFLGTMVSTLEPARLSLDILSWPIDGVPTYTSQEMRFLSALTGGFLVGWGVMIGCLRAWLYDTAPEPVRRVVLTSLVSWFILDSAGSIASGIPSNAVFNVFFLFLAVGPLWLPANEQVFYK